MKPMKSLHDYLKDFIKVKVELGDDEVELEVAVDYDSSDKLTLREVKLNGAPILDELSPAARESVRKRTVHVILQYTYDLADYREAVKEAQHDFQRDA